MATSFTLNMNEDVLFKHPSSMKSIPGTLYLTTLRVTWIATAAPYSSKNILLPWTQIKDDKYSKSSDEKQRCMIRLLSVNGDALVFSLSGAPTPRLRDELERAKMAVKKGRQGSNTSGNNPPQQTTPAAKQKKPAVASAVPPSAGLPSQEVRSEAERREALLSADAELRRLHAELVGGGVITAEEFWSARSQLLSDHEGRDTASRRGMTSSLLCDVQHAEVTGQGARRFQLTPEAVMDIFQMYPAVLEEYTTKVPEQMSRDEFWVRYFQHQAFNNSSRAPPSSLPRRHAMQSLPLSSSSSSSSSRAGNRRQQEERILSGGVASDVDLTQTFGDYHAAERLDPEDSQFRPSAVCDKYKRKGRLVLEQQQQGSQLSSTSSSSSSSRSSSSRSPAVTSKRARRGSSSSSSSVSEWETNEHLLNHEDPAGEDIPLHLHPHPHPLASGERPPSLLQTPLPAAAAAACLSPPGGGVGRRQGVFPSPERASQVLRREQARLDSFTEVARRAAGQEGGRGSGSDSGRGSNNGSGGGAVAVAASLGSGDSAGAGASPPPVLEHMQTAPELEQVSAAANT
jgi:hypothetical protein